MIESVQGGYQAQAVRNYSRTTNVEAVRSSAQGDSVSLSDAGKLLSSFFSGFGIDNPDGGTITVDEAEAALERKRDKLEDDVNALFLENGVSLSPEIKLTTDGAGQVRVQGDHPQKDEIEALFEDNPELANDFRAVSGLASHVEAAREHMDFAALYRQDPETAVARYGRLFDGTEDDGEFVLTIGEPVAGIDRLADAQAVRDREVSEWKDDGSITAMTPESAAAFLASMGDGWSPGAPEFQESPADEVVDGALPDTERVLPQMPTSLDFDSPNKQPHGGVNFRSLTRSELRDWVNTEIKLGYMTVEESTPFVSMTVKISAETGQPVDIENDRERCDFIGIAKTGLAAALERGDDATAEKLRSALDSMGVRGDRQTEP